ncbi:MAG: dTDP-glucose 4,6-dehydratase [Steroidobacterales bacterium]
MARLLVTGGAGFIGANFVHYWLGQHPGDRLVVLDALTYAGNRGNLKSAESRAEYRFVHGDICDTGLVERLLREDRLDTIVHLAAESHVDRSIEGSDAFVHTNVVGTHSMLKAARRVWLEERTVPTHRFHHVSTDEVYGSLGPDDPPFTEITPYAPNSPYSASKAASDHLVRAYHHTYGLQTTISNCSNNYGPYQFAEKLIPLMIAQLLAGKSLPVYGDGRNVRDWLHAEDHCRGIDAVLSRGRPGEVYNIGGRSECENIHLVHALCTIVDEYLGSTDELRRSFPNCAVAQGEISERLVRYVKDRPGHDRRYAIDCAKVERECAFKPRIALEDGLRLTVRWYLDRADTLRSGWQRTLS